MTEVPHRRWRIAPGQRLHFEEFEDGTVMFDTMVGATHLLNATAAEAIDIVVAHPDLDAGEIQRRICERLRLTTDALPLDAVRDLLEQLEDLNVLSDAPR